MYSKLNEEKEISLEKCNKKMHVSLFGLLASLYPFQATDGTLGKQATELNHSMSIHFIVIKIRQNKKKHNKSNSLWNHTIGKIFTVSL